MEEKTEIQGMIIGKYPTLNQELILVDNSGTVEIWYQGGTHDFTFPLDDVVARALAASLLAIVDDYHNRSIRIALGGIAGAY